MEVVGLNKENVLKISKIKDEEKWIRDYRLDSYEKFKSIGMPEFGPKIDLDFKKSVIAVMVGVLLAGLIMMAVSFGLFEVIL